MNLHRIEINKLFQYIDIKLVKLRNLKLCTCVCIYGIIYSILSNTFSQFTTKFINNTNNAINLSLSRVTLYTHTNLDKLLYNILYNAGVLVLLYKYSFPLVYNYNVISYYLISYKKNGGKL